VSADKIKIKRQNITKAENSSKKHLTVLQFQEAGYSQDGNETKKSSLTGNN